MLFGIKTNNKLLSKMLHCKIAVAYSCWEFPLAGGFVRWPKGGRAMSLT